MTRESRPFHSTLFKSKKDSLMPTYEPRYCAFVDILGFEELIKDLRHDDKQYLALRTALQTVHKPKPATPESGEADFRAQSISDAVAISTAVNADGLRQLFLALETLALDLLESGHFIRGAIVKGGLYHDKQMVFGEALVDAFRLESTMVRYPRMMIRREVFNDAVAYFAHDEWKTYIRTSPDGPRFLHVLRRIAEVVPQGLSGLTTAPDPNEISRFVKMRNQIEKRWEEAVDNPRHYEKVQWFVDYWSRYCVPVRMVPALKGLGPINPPRGFVRETRYLIEGGAEFNVAENG
jgi:hypothetical protein